MAYPDYVVSRAFVTKRRTAGNVALTTTPAAVDAAGLDIVLKDCQVDDVIEYVLSALWNNDAASAKADVVTVAGSPAAAVSSFASDGGAPPTGGASPTVSAWYGTPSAYVNAGGSAFYRLKAADLTDGAVTLRLLAWGTSGAKTIFASAEYPLVVAARNIGPVQGA